MKKDFSDTQSNPKKPYKEGTKLAVNDGSKGHKKASNTSPKRPNEKDPSLDKKPRS